MVVYEKEIEVEANKDKLDEVTAFVEDALDEHEVSPKAQMAVSVALEEIFVNVASYAYPEGGGNVTLQLSIENDPNVVSITFIDSGIPFNPLEKADPDVSLSAEERGIGGLGIYMTKKAMDQVDYRYEGEKNIFVMRKNF